MKILTALLKITLQKADLLYFKDLKKDRLRTVFFFAQSAQVLPMSESKGDETFYFGKSADNARLTFPLNAHSVPLRRVS